MRVQTQDAILLLSRRRIPVERSPAIPLCSEYIHSLFNLFGEKNDRLVAFSFTDARVQNSTHRILFEPLKRSSRARAQLIHVQFIPHIFHSLIQLLHCSAVLNAVYAIVRLHAD